MPDIEVYIEALRDRVLGQTLEHVRLASPFLLRTVSPALRSAEGRSVHEIRRVGKRIAVGVNGDIWLVIHLMIAGRLHWREKGAAITQKLTAAAFDFTAGTLLFTEAGSQKRASLHVVAGEEGLRSLDPGGLEVFEADLAAFQARLTESNHTLKRALTDPRLFSGIGNAYSDEILHAARLSPVTLTQRMNAAEIERLYEATRETLRLWTDRLRILAKISFPKKSLPFARAWLSTAASSNPVRYAGPKCNASAMQRMKQTTARHARRAGGCWRIARYHACCGKTGRAQSRSSKP